eukprot:NODE_2085_length_1284_cov_21.431288_g1984_i0.p1 GENE.NODE_2085_length_1284_cov_21.431288_g1984_i0~~NODE_2085_length_1284_cov_21.431288_g1984_i0.p1  ORF type:complete len:333 (+),score=35.50 NODE_2085_length_1284_cov_21.431288_g1984_i0:23-1000(+)
MAEPVQVDKVKKVKQAKRSKPESVETKVKKVKQEKRSQPESAGKWQYDSSSGFKDFPEDISSILETAFTAGKKSVEVVQPLRKNQTYRISFKYMQQSNLSADSHKQRGVRRVESEHQKLVSKDDTSEPPNQEAGQVIAEKQTFEPMQPTTHEETLEPTQPTSHEESLTKDVFVGGLPEGVEDGELKAAFKTLRDSVVDIRWVKWNSCFVEFTTPAVAAEAAKMALTIGTTKLRLGLARQTPRNKATPIVCFHCSQVGHIYRTCPTAPPKNRPPACLRLHVSNVGRRVTWRASAKTRTRPSSAGASSPAAPSPSATRTSTMCSGTG